MSTAATVSDTIPWVLGGAGLAVLLWRGRLTRCLRYRVARRKASRPKPRFRVLTDLNRPEVDPQFGQLEHTEEWARTRRIIAEADRDFSGPPSRHDPPAGRKPETPQRGDSDA